jgi:GT2 family glycosyltransferase
MMELEDLWLVIPTAERHQYLHDIFTHSGVPAAQRILVRTSAGKSIDSCINLWYSGELNIHSWWNMGITHVQANGGRFIAVLNDDIRIGEDTLALLLDALKRSNSTLAVPVNSGEAGWGHCWVLDVSHGIYPDERFKWWCGDHDLEIRAKRKGGVAYLPLHVPNLHANELTSGSSYISELTVKDIWKFRRKYPHLFIKEIGLRLKRFSSRLEAPNKL